MYLTCNCGNKDFVDIHKLRTSQAGSVVKEVAGSRCTACAKNKIIGMSTTNDYCFFMLDIPHNDRR